MAQRRKLGLQRDLETLQAEMRLVEADIVEKGAGAERLRKQLTKHRESHGTLVTQIDARLKQIDRDAMLAARPHLKRLRWAMETSAERDAFGRDVFATWDAATASAARGAKRALEEAGALMARAADALAARTAKTGVGFVGPADATRRAADAAALVRALNRHHLDAALQLERGAVVAETPSRPKANVLAAIACWLISLGLQRRG